MGLRQTCESFLGKQVDVRPFYGWGWHRRDPNLPALTYDEAAGPPPFRAEVLAFFSEGPEVRGGSAIVRDPGHSLDGQFIVFSTRHVGTFDFGDPNVAYNVAIGPILSAGPLPRIEGSVGLDGWAKIAAF